MRLSSSFLAIVALVHLTACGGPEPVEENIVTPVEVVEAPAPEPQQQIPGFGPVTIRAMGTTPKPPFGVVYPGDCDGNLPDDDLEVMTFSAPWKTSGGGGGGASARYGSPATRTFPFEKDPNIMKVHLQLDFGLERRDRTAADLTAGYSKVADLAFSPGSVALYRANNPDHMLHPYIAVFPLIDREGMPQEREFTGRYLAIVQLTPGGLPEFEGWSQAEIIQLFESFYAARCLGEGLKQAWAAVSPTLIFE